MAIKIRRAKIVDIPSLAEKLFKFYSFLKERGAKDIAHDDQVLRGGVVIEIGNGFANPNWFCTVAVKGEEVVAFMIGMLEFCPPISEFHKCVRIHADYNENSSLASGKILTNMWKLIEVWGAENGADFYYANIHPGNQPSVRAAKSIGFKHQYTQFYKFIEPEKQEEIE